MTTDRDSIADFIEARARKLREQADSGVAGWALAKHDAVLFDALASDIRNVMDVREEQA